MKKLANIHNVKHNVSFVMRDMPSWYFDIKIGKVSANSEEGC